MVYAPLIIIKHLGFIKEYQKMGNIFKRFVKTINGNSLAEFAVTTAVMATLAATAAPKLSKLSEGTKAEKTYDHIDKLIKQAGNFYQKTADTEGRGRFPGQYRFYEPVGEPNNIGGYYNDDFSTAGVELARVNSAMHHDAILRDLGLMDTDGWRGTQGQQTENRWVWVFDDIHDYYQHDNYAYHQFHEVRNYHHGAVGHGHNSHEATYEWLSLFGDEVLSSPFQNGNYAYTVVAGGGSGDDVYPPVIYIVDVENAVHYNNVLTP